MLKINSGKADMATNQYGLDTNYMRSKLNMLVRDADNYKPDEMARALARLVLIADADVLQEPEFFAAPRPVPTCDWQEDADGIWETSCGEAWVCTDGTPAENNMKFCHSCGKHLKEHRYAEPDGGAV